MKLSIFKKNKFSGNGRYVLKPKKKLFTKKEIQHLKKAWY